MKKLLLLFWFSLIVSCGAYVAAKPAIACVVSCNRLYIYFNPQDYTVEGLGELNCFNGSQFCEFYTLLTVWYTNQNGQLVYLNSDCAGGAMRCGSLRYPINTSPTQLQPGYKYTIVFSVYDVNRGCGDCSDPVVCNPSCSIYTTVDLR